MLRKEDCKPGVEVIAIKNIIEEYANNRPPLMIGHIYTIEDFTDKCTSHGKWIELEVVSLHEIPRSRQNGIRWGYTLDQFKLRRKEEFTELFKTSDLDLKKIREKESVDA